MFRVVKFGRYVIVHAICHVSLNVRIKRKKKKDNIESLGRLCFANILALFRSQMEQNGRDSVPTHLSYR